MSIDIAKLKAAAERAKAAAADYQSGVIDAGVFYCRAAEFHRLTDSPEQTLELIAALEAAEEMVELQRFKLERQAEDLHQAKSLESIHREKRYEVEREFNSYKYETDRNFHRLASEVTRLEDALELAGINLETGGEA
ncbi:hypothetical protein ACP26C_13790 [Franconibacter helveticus 513]|uniref:hypothetical protein n=1 Tax=Franconibacter helveticus TaxID=357240 RepID=UPI000409CBE0|nr:hypothetical protein [Franconibacter helveticus]